MLSNHLVSLTDDDSDRSVNCTPTAAIRSLYDANVWLLNSSTERVWRGVLGSKSRSRTPALCSAASDDREEIGGRLLILAEGSNYAKVKRLREVDFGERCGVFKYTDPHLPQELRSGGS